MLPLGSHEKFNVSEAPLFHDSEVSGDDTGEPDENDFTGRVSGETRAPTLLAHLHSGCCRGTAVVLAKLVSR